MINKLGLENFKCFREIDLTFSMVNILTGLNGMGKSTVMQSILLLGQSQKSIITENILSLKGKYVGLGVGQDILFEKAEEDEIRMAITIDDQENRFLFEYLPDVDALPLRNSDFNEKNENWMGKMTYLSAYRIEPQFLYRIENEKDLSERYFGKDGEYAIQYLKLCGEENITNEALIAESDDKLTINKQVKKWLDIISPGVSPVININMSSRTAELQYEYIESREKTNSYKSVNVGFGITYVLPVVVALVSANKGDIILIENPEAHIHPKGQRILGELIATVGAGGVQVIVETHSDHVLNGIRVAVKKRKLESEKTKLFYFYKDSKDSYKHKVMCPVLDINGRINEWPEGFFDEWDNALMELL